MHAFLDIRTLSLFSGFISACLFICMSYIYKYQKTYPGFGQWTLAYILNFIGFILLSLRNVLPAFFTIIMANTLIVLFFSLIARGLLKFGGGKQRIWTDIFFFTAFILSFIYFTYLSPDVNARIAIISFAFSVWCLYCTSITARRISENLGSKNILLMVTFVSMALWFLMRAILTLFVEGRIPDFMSAGSLHGFSIIAVSTGSILIATGLMIVNAHRIENDLSKRTDELTHLNDKLTDSEERFRSLSDAAFEGIVISEKGIVLEVNEAMARLFGYKPMELVNFKAIGLVDPEVRKEVENKIVSGHQHRYETIGLKKDGTRFPIEVKGKMFTYKNREVRVTAVHDLTEQKKTEEALLESQRMQGVIEMAGAVCHEMNQPLMAISGYLELLSLDRTENEDMSDWISKISKQIDRLGQITQRLMHITRYETKAYPHGKIIDIEKSSKDPSS